MINAVFNRKNLYTYMGANVLFCMTENENFLKFFFGGILP